MQSVTLDQGKKEPTQGDNSTGGATTPSEIPYSQLFDIERYGAFLAPIFAVIIVVAMVIHYLSTRIRLPEEFIEFLTEPLGRIIICSLLFGSYFIDARITFVGLVIIGILQSYTKPRIIETTKRDNNQP
jgi:hypothetical protein